MLINTNERYLMMKYCQTVILWFSLLIGNAFGENYYISISSTLYNRTNLLCTAGRSDSIEAFTWSFKVQSLAVYLGDCSQFLVPTYPDKEFQCESKQKQTRMIITNTSVEYHGNDMTCKINYQNGLVDIYRYNITVTSYMVVLFQAIIFVGMIFGASEVKLSSSKSFYENHETVVLTCTVPDFADTVEVLGTYKRIIVSCFAGLPCTSPPSGYTANKRGSTLLDLTITSFNHTQDTGDWTCIYGRSSSTFTLYHAIPVSNASIQSDDVNNIVSVVAGDSTTFTCTTDSSRPAAWIQWYIGGRNVTNDAVPETPQPNGTMFIASSKLIYTGTDTDHNKTLHCEAVNVEDKEVVKSIEKVIYIQVPVTKLTFEPVGSNDVITVIADRNSTFTCTTGPSRPAAKIQWYIGAKNVTNDAISHTPHLQGTVYVSSSTLVYMTREEDNGTIVYCEASNIEGKQKVKSSDKSIHIGYFPDKVQEVIVMCFDTALGVAWRSESDRGNQQIFQVVLQNLLTDRLLYSNNVSDQGTGSILQYTTQLYTATSYLIYIESTNIYGTVRSDAVRYCNTTGLTTTTIRGEPLSFSVGFGSGAALIVFINIIAIIVVLVIKQRSRISERSKVYEQTKQGSSDINLYNELDETQSGSGRSVQDYRNVAYEEITSTVDQTSTLTKPREK